MISQDDIEAMQDAETADLIVERAEKGVPQGRLMHANEEMPLVRAYVRMTRLCAALTQDAVERLKRDSDNLDIGG